MENHKVEEEYVYKELGFPVKLLNVSMVRVRGVWVPAINLNVLQKLVLTRLAHLPSQLTGNHIRFIRTYLECNVSRFAKVLGVTHQAVMKWEKTGDKSSKISLTTEREIRLLILDRVLQDDEEFRKSYRIILKIELLPKRESLEINAPTDLVAI